MATKQKRAALGDLECFAPTMREAKAGLQEKLSKAVRGSYVPRIIVIGDNMAIVWREPTGCWYSILHEGRMGGFSTGGNSLDDTEQAARGHLAQLALDRTNTYHRGDIPCDWGLTEEQMDNLLSLARFQRAYRAAVGNGLADHEAHAWACNHSHEFANRAA